MSRSYSFILSRGRLKKPDALDASEETPGLHVRNDSGASAGQLVVWDESHTNPDCGIVPEYLRSSAPIAEPTNIQEWSRNTR